MVDISCYRMRNRAVWSGVQILTSPLIIIWLGQQSAVLTFHFFINDRALRSHSECHSLAILVGRFYSTLARRTSAVPRRARNASPCAVPVVVACLTRPHQLSFRAPPRFVQLVQRRLILHHRFCGSAPLPSFPGCSCRTVVTKRTNRINARWSYSLLSGFRELSGGISSPTEIQCV
jgi:hypothetical protein